MKLLLILSISIISFGVAAKKPTKDFGAELLRDVKADVKKDESTFKKPSPSRAPASIPTPISEERPLDKKTNQLGKPVW